MRVILRADDINALTDPAQLQRVYRPLWERGVPVCLSVIPRSATHFTARGPQAVEPVDLREAPALCDFLTGLARAGLAEIALHGYEHRYGELASGTQAQLAERITAGLELLREALPGVPVQVLVPPHDHISPAGVRAARQLGLRLCSSWAACHGGTRLAHFWSRVRRRAGWLAEPLRGGCWATDCDLLDFDSPEAQPPALDLDAHELAARHLTARDLVSRGGVSRGPAGAGSRASASPTPPETLSALTTRRLLARFGGSRAPIALPQHYWRLLDASGKPNARHVRWLEWLAATVFSTPAAVEVVRYGD